MHLFCYGTLMDMDVLAAVLRRDVSSISSFPAGLAGFRRVRARDHTFPILLPSPGDRVEGLLLAALEPEDITRLDAYEGPGYARHVVEVSTGRGPERAEIYLPHMVLEDSGEGWDLEEWRRRWRADLLRELRG